VSAPAERFVIRWVNGVWVIFDTVKYEHARTAGTRKEIDRIYATGK
jgi:hypothetical protein